MTTDRERADRKRSDWSSFVPSLVVTLVGTLFAGGLVAWFSVQLQQGFAEAAAAAATCENPQRLRLATDVTVTASSALAYTDASGGERTFPPEHLVDSSRQTAWVAAVDEGGVGTQIVLRLPAEADARLVCVLNGFARTSELYDANGSVRVLEVTTANGSRDAALPRLTDENVFAYQQLAFAPGPTREIALTVQAADVPAEADLGPVSATISEIEIWVAEG